MNRLQGKVAIVTGAALGLGHATAVRMAEEGASVALVDTRDKEGEALATELRGRDLRARYWHCDVVKEAEVARVMGEVARHFGRIDILVNNAGVLLGKTPEEYSLEEWYSIIDTNLTGAFIGSRAVFPEMKRQGGGKIVNIASLTATFGSPFNVPYTASKGGILQLTRGLAAAWAMHNIQVNAISPGWIDTGLAAGIRARIPGFNEKVVARTPAGRWGQAADFAGVAVFLSSRASDFITGAAIPVDGGYSIQL